MIEPIYTQDWFSGNIPAWKQYIGPLRAMPSLTGLEIGCFEGRSTRWLMENVFTDSQARLYVIDTFTGSPEHESMHVAVNQIRQRFFRNLKPYIDRITVLEGKSEDMIRQVDHELDFVYIDGSHVAVDVMYDLIGTWKRMKPGAILIADDYGWDYAASETQKPKVAIDMFFERIIPANSYRILDKGYQFIVQKYESTK